MADKRPEQKATVRAERTVAGGESTYTVRELAENAQVFGVQPEMVTAALGGTGKITQREAAERIEAFRKKEVK